MSNLKVRLSNMLLRTQWDYIVVLFVGSDGDVVDASREGHLTEVHHYGITSTMGGRRGHASGRGT